MMSTDILELCDRVLGEVSRRQHRFAWLVAPGAAPGEWLSVDAYYPGRRLVVVLDGLVEPLCELCAELVPQHGLHLLRLSAEDLGADRAAAEPALRGLLGELRLPERIAPASEAAPRAPARLEDAFARVATSFAHAATPARPPRPVRPSQAEAAQRAVRVLARTPAPARPRPTRPAPRSVRGHPPASRRPRAATAQPGSVAPALGLAVVLSAIVAAELYLGVARLTLDGGPWGLALGLGFDACSRVLGTIAARRSDATASAWRCAIAGSPAVAMFTLFGRDGPVAVDPAPLAGVLSVLATLLSGGALIFLLLRV